MRVTDLRGALLREADLSEADMEDAFLSGADLRGAVLRRTNLRGAVLEETNCIGVDFSDATLSDCSHLWHVQLGCAARRHTAARSVHYSNRPP